MFIIIFRCPEIFLPLCVSFTYSERYFYNLGSVIPIRPEPTVLPASWKKSGWETRPITIRASSPIHWYIEWCSHGQTRNHFVFSSCRAFARHHETSPSGNQADPCLFGSPDGLVPWLPCSLLSHLCEDFFHGVVENVVVEVGNFGGWKGEVGFQPALYHIT